MTRPRRDSCLACMKINIGTECNDTIREIFKECISLEISIDSKCSMHICKTCHKQLLEYQKFRQMCWKSFLHQKQLDVPKSEDKSVVGTIPEVKHEDHKSDTSYQQNIIAKDDEKDVSLPLKCVVKCSESPNDVSDGVLEVLCTVDPIPIKFQLDENINPTFKDIALPKNENENKSAMGEEHEANSAVGEDNDEESNDNTFTKSDDGDEESNQSVPRLKRMRVKRDRIDAPIKNFCCIECGKRFKKQDYLDAHTREHNGLKPWRCSVCDKEFVRRSGLDRHKKSAHDNSEGFTCDEPNCGKSYTFYESLRHHIRIVHENGVKAVKKIVTCVCELCGKSFTSKGNLLKHSYTHNGQWPFQCTICLKRYATKHKLKEHTMRHQGIKNHVCTVCGLRKTTNSELKMHMNYHTKERTFPCTACNMIFMSVGNRSRHIKVVHCGIKEYNCPHCERSFGKQETLNHHVMTHTGEKPHECVECGMRFIQKTALKTHQKTHIKVRGLIS